MDDGLDVLISRREVRRGAVAESDEALDDSELERRFAKSLERGLHLNEDDHSDDFEEVMMFEARQAVNFEVEEAGFEVGRTFAVQVAIPIQERFGLFFGDHIRGIF